MDSPRICYCNKVGKVNTSWTTSNPGRRFIGCERYGLPHACGYFIWIDPPMCERSKVVIPGLPHLTGRHEAEKQNVEEEGHLAGSCPCPVLVYAWCCRALRLALQVNGLWRMKWGLLSGGFGHEGSNGQLGFVLWCCPD
ncbi:hypothetical protein Vadar_006136 [Vaccinium darrowii]|uniref:Uncharacterized protein n=1 Tax=Vaccinium darrowii TaxID=229202 RepID=A0ACB7ZAQ9_9ERIC|nr:hypothetical protein Vadar_006136 [Vaccinium darrowii]